MYLSPFRLAGMAGVFAVAVVGAAMFGRLTATPAAGGGPAATPTPESTVLVSIGTYRTARNAICERYAGELNPLKPQLDGIYDPGLDSADRSAKTAILTRIADRADAMVGELGQLAVPTEVVADHAAQIAHMTDTDSLIRREVLRLEQGDLSGAKQLDLATDPNSRLIESFEAKYGLAPCP